MNNMMGGDISQLFNTLLGLSKPVDYETILSGPNVAEADFVRSALNILTDPDDDEEHDESVTDIAKTKLAPDYLRGIMTGMVIAIYADYRAGVSGPNPTHNELANIYERASAYLLEYLE
tara:strand:+ start:468 stop:824 length:357 start_codon:yes stop_codon:yes gene_type:complete